MIWGSSGGLMVGTYSCGVVLAEGAGHAGLRTGRTMAVTADNAKAEGWDLPEP